MTKEEAEQIAEKVKADQRISVLIGRRNAARQDDKGYHVRLTFRRWLTIRLHDVEDFASLLEAWQDL